MASRPPPRFFGIYKTFVVLAIVGRQKAADSVCRNNIREIERVASYLNSISPIDAQRCYRGLLIEPDDVVNNQVAGQFQSATYISLSEDLEVACWFADTNAFISDFRMQQVPRSVGWIAEYVPAGDDIIFHHSWTDYLNSAAPGPNLYEAMADIAPQIGMPPQEAVMQLQWNLKTQEEVILKTGIPLEVRRVETYNCPETQELNDKYRPRPDFILAPDGLQSLGISPNERLNIDKARFPDPFGICPMCGDYGITVIYLLDRANLKVYSCSTCGQKSFGI
jgi:predicted RNA-binding Zn-ribbon protein involved in translation (DUF1610 family)